MKVRELKEALSKVKPDLDVEVYAVAPDDDLIIIGAANYASIIYLPQVSEDYGVFAINTEVGILYTTNKTEPFGSIKERD